MNILWFSWKDLGHPTAGGAETVSGEIMKRLVRDGHHVHLITSGYAKAPSEDSYDGIKISRVGNRWTVYCKAFFLYRRRFRHWPDLIIDEMNTLPFGAAFYAKQRTVLLSYQLARKVWFYQIAFPLSVIGYLIEPFYLFLLSRRYPQVMTESESSRQDMTRFGFKADAIQVFRVGMALEPIKKLEPKSNRQHIVFLGALRPMKQALDAVKAFELARDKNPNLSLTLAGDAGSRYGQKVKEYVKRSRHSAAITVAGRVSTEKRLAFLREANLILVTSVKEGWGLIVTEANSQGTPAVVYDTDGLRDSVRNDQTGLVVRYKDTTAMAQAVLRLIDDAQTYDSLRVAAWEWSKEFSFENSYHDFTKHLNIKSPQDTGGA